MTTWRRLSNRTRTSEPRIRRGSKAKSPQLARWSAKFTATLDERIKFETKDGVRVIQIMRDDCKTPLAGNGPHGLATFDDLASEAAKSWPSLFEKSAAVPGNEGEKSDDKTISRAEWDKLDPHQRSAKMKAGCRIVDNKPPPKAAAGSSKPPAAASQKPTMRRAEWDKLDPHHKASTIKSGVRLVDSPHSGARTIALCGAQISCAMCYLMIPRQLSPGQRAGCATLGRFARSLSPAASLVILCGSITYFTGAPSSNIL